MQNFDFYGNPLSRNTDPDTSKEAEKELRETRIGKRRAQVYDLVSRYPGLTAKELGRLFIEEHPEIEVISASLAPNKRLSELRDEGLIEMGPTRKCGITGRNAHTWRCAQQS